VPYSKDEANNRRLSSAIAKEGSVPDYMEFENVKRF